MTFKPKQPLRFLPQDRLFWLYHCGACVVWMSLNLLLHGVDGFKDNPTQFFITLFIGVEFTVAVLVLRYGFKKWTIVSRPIWLQLLYGFVVSAVLAILSIVIMLIVYWSYYQPQFTGKENVIAAYWFFIIGRAWIFQLYVGLWFFLYLTISYFKNYRQVEIDNLQLEKSLSDAKLVSLSNQLNPHFLFNSLNNIRFLIYESQCGADKAITSFSELLRFSLMRSEDKTVLLDEELTMARKYIDVMRLQLDERLDYQEQIAIDTQIYYIPPMLIQMLLENAIKHGVEHIEQPSQLLLKVFEAQSMIKIEVTNQVNLQAVESKFNTGKGLENIRQRLNLLYGSSAELLLTQLDTQFVVAVNIEQGIAKQCLK